MWDEREALRAPFLDAQLNAIGALRVHNQCCSWHASPWRAEPAQGIRAADPLHADVLEHSGVPHDHGDQVVDEGTDGQFL
jgi:hypothetical protein